MSRKSFVVFLVFLLCFSVVSVFIKIPSVNALSTLTFSSSTSDGCAWTNNVDYDTSHGAASATPYDTDTIFYVGQTYMGGSYASFRGFLFFDTSSLPNSATIDSAILSIYVSADNSIVDFNVTIQKGEIGYPHDPLITGDYYYQHYSGDGGSRNTSEVSGSGYWNITLNSDGYDMISLIGATRLCLRSDKDISSTAPTEFEYLSVNSAEAGASYTAKLYVTYSLPPATYTLTVSSNPEINAAFTVNGTNYNTPSYVSITENNTAQLIAEEAKIYNGEGYLFDHWLINGTDSYTTQSLDLTITGDTTIAIHYVEIPDLYYFYGPFDEETGLAIDENVTVTVYYDTDTYPAYSFTFNGSWVYPTSPQAMFFRFNFSDGTFREYWVDPSEDVLPIYIFHGNITGNIQEYIINFMDNSGILDDYPFVTIKRYVNGTAYTVEKRKVDKYNSILANLIYTRTYQIYLGNEETTYVFGDLTMTSQTAIQLVLRAVDFPTDTDFLVMNKYVRIYGYRNFTAGSITINYNDTKEDTTSVFISISNSTHEVYNNTLYTDNFSVEWSSAVNNITYYAEATINHGTYGEIDWRQVFAATSDVTPPFGLEFLGDWGFDSFMLIPALICLCTAGCFSKLNAYVGAILMMITALALAWMGWFPVPASLLVVGFALAFLMALVYHKRGVHA